MIACVIHGAKELKIENRPEPALPQDGEVLVRFGAGGICGSDLHYYHEGGILDFKIREPLILGHEVAGEVVEIGPGVTKVSVRDRVAVNPLRSCYRCVTRQTLDRHVIPTGKLREDGRKLLHRKRVDISLVA
jgi:L-idonate 5-dehydrogenase